MYLATAAIGIILIIIGYLMPYESNNVEYSTTKKVENSGSDTPSGTDTFSLELLEKQAELANKRIDILQERFLELEDYLKENITNISKNSDENTEFIDNNSVIPPNNLTDSNENESVSIKDINTIIYNMYDNGASLDDISSELRIGRGELQLRLGLRKSQGQ